MHKINHFFKTIIHHTKNFTLSTPSAILIGSVIIAGSIIAYGFIVQGGSSNTTDTMFAGREIDESDYIDGNAKSKVFVIEYSDPECPYCTAVHSTMKQIRTEYSDKIAFVYR